MKVFNELLLIIFICFCGIYTNAQFLTPQVDSIVMRDNKKLAADVYLPNGGTTALPTILIQTPYNRLYYRWSLPLGIGINLNSSHYNIVVVDWRCFFGSAAACVAQPDRGKDGYDVVEWIATQSWSNGKIGTWGPSALGKIQFQTAKENPPHLKCIVPLVAFPNFKYNEYYPGGVLRTEYVEQLDNLGFGVGTFVYANPYYNIMWQYAASGSNYPGSIQVPCFMIGGWYDHNVDGMIDFYNAIKQSSPVAVRDKHKLLFGPWVHGGHGSASVGSTQQGELSFPEAEGYSDSLAMVYFDYYLRDVNNAFISEPAVKYFVIGQNEWRSSAIWPPAGLEIKDLYFQSGNGLAEVLPTGTTFTSFQYDPTDPSPTYGGPTLRNDLLQGPYDQSQVVESRSDVVAFTTPVLISPVEFFGKVVVRLKVSTDRADTDFAIRLCDVYPDNRSMLINDGIMRCRFINGYEQSQEVFLPANQVREIVVELPHTSYAVMPGHRIRVDVSSSNYPRFDNNLNNGLAMYQSGDSLVATQKVFHETTQASYAELMVTPSTQVNSFDVKKLGFAFPNPAFDYIKISEEETGAIEIIDIFGKSMGIFPINENKIIDISDLDSGCYFLIHSSTGFVSKIIHLKN